jgi:diacylglycerol kinase (ATP)
LITRADKNLPLLKRLQFACAGFAAALRSEHSLRFHLLAALVVFMVLIVFRPEPTWWALVALTSTAVVAAELFNTALERLADLLHPEQHEQIRIMKDCAAAAVLVASVGALVVAAALAVHVLSR